MFFTKNNMLVAAVAFVVSSSCAFAQSEMKSDGMKSDGMQTGAMKSGTAMKGDTKPNMSGRSDSMPEKGTMTEPTGTAPMSGDMKAK